MKKVKFKPHLIQPILDGAKTVTWRLFDDKNLSVGDYLEFISSESGEKFAETEITRSQEKRIKELSDVDLVENNYRDRSHVTEVNKNLYGDEVNDETIVKIIEFKLLRKFV